MSSDPHEQLQVLGTLKRSYYKSVPLCELHGDIKSSCPKRNLCEEVRVSCKSRGKHSSFLREDYFKFWFLIQNWK